MHAKLEIETSKPEWAGILRLEQICNQSSEFEARGGTNDLDDGAPKELIILILEAAEQPLLISLRQRGIVVVVIFKISSTWDTLTSTSK